MFNTIVWLGYQQQTICLICLYSTKCNTMFWGRLPFVTLSFGYSTKCNNLLAWHHCNSIIITTTNAKTSVKYNTIMHDNICNTKCNNNDWFYPGNGTKYISRLFINFLCTHAACETSTDRE